MKVRRISKNSWADIDEPTLPFNLVDVHGDGLAIEETSQELDLDLSRQIRTLARQWKVSPATLFHMAWGLVVSRCSDREEVVFGTMMLGRLQGVEGADRIMGMFLNMLPLRLSVQPELSVSEYLQKTHQRVTGLLPYEQVPLVTAQGCSAVPAGTPLFSAILNYRHSEEVNQEGAEVQEPLGIEELGGEERTNYPFDLSVDDLGDGFSMTVQVDRSVEASRGRRLCPSRVLSRWLTRLERLPREN